MFVPPTILAIPLQALHRFSANVWCGLIDVHPMGHLSLRDIKETSYQLFRKMFLSKPDQIFGCSTTMLQLISVAQSQSTWTGAEAVVGFVGRPNVWPRRSPEFKTPLTCGDT